MPEWYLEQYDRWVADGTTKRVMAAVDAKQPVQVRRSDGSISIGTICKCGIVHTKIEIKIDGEKPLYKMADADEFLELNPGFGPSHIELRPASARKQRET